MKAHPATRQYRPNGQSVLVLKYLIKNATDTRAAPKAHKAPTSAWPRTPFPSGPIRSGILTTPAARITGVASRKEKRAAVLVIQPAHKTCHHRDARATDAGEEGQHLGGPDYACFLDVELLSRVEVVLFLPQLGAAPGELTAEEYEPVRDEEDRSGQRFREEYAQLVLEQEPRYARGDRRHDKQPSEALVRRRDGAVRIE